MTTRDKPQPTHKRTLSSRLNSLLSPQDPGPSTSRTAQLLDVPNGLGRGANTTDMRTPRLGLPSPSSSGLASSAASGAARLPTTSSNGTKPKQQKQKPHLDLSMSIPSQPSSALPSPLKSPLPVLRWSGRPCTTTSTSSSPNGSLSASASPGSSRSGSPLSALHDALNSELPTSPPPSAHVHSIQPPPEVHHQHPQHQHTHPQHPHQPHSQQHDQEQERQQHQQQHNSIPSHFLARSPTYLRTLTLSTLPTSSLSSIPSPSYPYYNDHPPSAGSGSGSGSGAGWGIPEMTVAHSPPTRSSLDTLRSLSLHSPTATGTSTSTHMHEPPLRRRHSPSHTNRTQSQSRSQSVDIREFTTSATNAAWKWWAGEGDAAVGERGEEKGESERSEQLLAEQDRAPTEEEERAKMQRKYLAPKHPIVFCHGLLGFDSVTIGPSIAPLEVTHWRGIKEALEAIGAEVLITRVPATSSPFDRAKVLEQRIEEVYPGRAVHLIGHSMGGLDCRYMTSNLHAHTFSVLSLTTIATPHRGSSFADHFLQTVGKTRFPSVLALLDMLPNGGGDGKAFECLTVEAMRKFNEETPDREGVRYFSWGAVYEPGLIDTWKWPHSVVLEKEGPNDGLVSIQSSKWGTYLGTLEDVNHLDLVGWINTARYKWAEIRGREIKFKPATFYLGCADLLARKVERLGEDGDADENASVSRDGSGSEDGEGEGEGEAKELGRQVADEGSEAGEAGKNKERAKANGGKLKVNRSHHLRRDEHDASSSSVQELGRKVAGESSKAAEGSKAAGGEVDGEARSRARPRAATETEEDITGRGMIFDAGELDSPDSPVDRRRSVDREASS